MTSDKLAAERKERQRELEQAMDELLARDLREGWRLNTMWWVGVMAGAFCLVLLLLIIVTGG
ncbi:MAG TPA: hypothetical protein VFQ81_05880 [Candidatus Limnocylindria bacterium]|nr:hypothetical protein [Candidatus Limnocylindria bacterium]